MIVPEEELVNYLGNDLANLEGRISERTLRKLKDYDEYSVTEFQLPIIDYLFLSHQQGNRSLRILSKEIGISAPTLIRIFELYGLPIVGNAEAMRRN
ncbi:MAG: hypothetical protein QXD72_02430 [Candidatus Aenigmatarchaeota archaeon]